MCLTCDAFKMYIERCMHKFHDTRNYIYSIRLELKVFQQLNISIFYTE